MSGLVSVQWVNSGRRFREGGPREDVCLSVLTETLLKTAEVKGGGRIQQIGFDFGDDYN